MVQDAERISLEARNVADDQVKLLEALYLLE